jgi:hypothetical protein
MPLLLLLLFGCSIMLVDFKMFVREPEVVVRQVLDFLGVEQHRYADNDSVVTRNCSSASLLSVGPEPRSLLIHICFVQWFCTCGLPGYPLGI